MNRKSAGRFFGKNSKNSKGSDKSTEQENVHRRNVRIAAYPLIFLFEIVRVLLYQIWLILSFAYRGLQSLSNTEKTFTVATEPSVDAKQQEINDTMLATKNAEKSKLPGAGEPVLSKQKHHHRKAFECISKALKLDEEDEGLYTIGFTINYACDVLVGY